MNWTVQRDELLMLSHIYCGPGEFDVSSGISTQRELGEDLNGVREVSYPLVISIRLTVPHHGREAGCGDSGGCTYDVVVTVEFSLSRDYPAEPPGIALQSSQLSSSLVETLEMEASQVAQSLVTELSLFQVLEHVKEVVMESLNTDPTLLHQQHHSDQPALNDCCPLPSNRISSGTLCTPFAAIQTRSCYHCLVQLDHMRSESHYTKCLHALSVGHGVRCRMVLTGGRRGIYVLLRGESREDVSKFIREWKTLSVDVDSQGRPCKEKMMTVLREGECHGCGEDTNKKTSSFEVIGCPKEDLAKHTSDFCH